MRILLPAPVRERGPRDRLRALIGGDTMAKGKGAEGKAFEIVKSDEAWRAQLTPEQFRVLREHGTERAGTSPLDKQYGSGAYRCAGCGLTLFSSDSKFDSGTGWPSFWAPLDDAVGTSRDRSFFMVRTEVDCRRCGGHFGLVFGSGPAPSA